MTDAMSDPLKPVQFLTRSSDSTTLHALGALPDDPPTIMLDLPAARLVQFSTDGSMLVLVEKEHLTVIYIDEDRRVVIPLQDVHGVWLSPKNTFLVTWQRPNAGNTQSQSHSKSGNVNVWDIQASSIVLSFNQQSFSQSTSVQWTDDEMIAARMVSNEIHLFNGRNLGSGIAKKLICPGVIQFCLSPGPPPFKVATFAPEKKGAPASVKVYKYPRVDSNDQPIGQRSFYRAQEVDLLWNSSGTSLLALSHTDVDKTGRSYYGETKLHYLSADGATEDCSVALAKDGPVYDVKWSPSGREFVVCHGFMPSRTVLYDARCRPVFDFGEAHRNTVRWAPHGRFLSVAGFGILAGDVDFWDRNKLKRMSKIHAPDSVSCAWGPDSRSFMVATLSPRLRVDNGTKVYSYNGEKLLAHLSYKELYEVVWRPSAGYPDRPASPRAPSDHSKGAADGSSPAPPPKRAVYRPPGARNDPNWKPSAAFHRSSAPPQKIERGFGNAPLPAAEPGSFMARHRTIPGAAADPRGKLSKGAIKKQKRREKKLQEATRTNAIAEAEASLAVMGPSSTQPRPQADAQHPERHSITSNQTMELMSGDAIQKRLRTVNKKLRQIDGLKTDLAAGKTLTPEQDEKIRSSASLEEERDSLAAQLELNSRS